MVGISDLFSGASFAQNLVRTNAAVSRPNFELQFNILQNTIIDRLNEKIAEVTADDGLQNDKIDVFLLQSAKKLTSFQQGIEKFIFENTGNANGVSSISERLDQLDAALDAGDTDAFNTALGKVNETTGLLTVTDGSTVGIFSNDGIQKLRNSGVVRFDNGGTTTKATSLSDFADTAAARTAVANARTETANVITALVLKAEGAEVVRKNTSTRLDSTLLQIEAARIADEADKATEIAKLREEYGQLLNAISLAFESSQTLTEQLGAKLFEPPELQSGSVINLFI
jgi:hypothetical protein